MKGQNGFTLLELILVVAIVGTILAIVTLNFHQMNEKYRVESCTREIYTILMKARNDASRTNVPQAVELAADHVTNGAYDPAVLPPPPVTFTGATVTTNFQQFTIIFSGPARFDRRGLTNDNQTIKITGYAAGVTPAVDCIVISATRINMGKLVGGTCEQR